MLATMTAPAAQAHTTRTFLPGWSNIFRKELQEWVRTRRFVVTSLLMTLLVGAVPVIAFLANGGLHDGRFDRRPRSL